MMAGAMSSQEMKLGLRATEACEGPRHAMPLAPACPCTPSLSEAGSEVHGGVQHAAMLGLCPM